jgi:putative ABC transport system permease protein
MALLGMGGFAVGAEGAIIAFRPSWQLGTLGLAVSVGVGLLAGIFPALQAARTPIITALREA